jgi:hypothetical protein
MAGGVGQNSDEPRAGPYRATIPVGTFAGERSTGWTDPSQGTSGPVLQRVTPGPVNSRLILTVVQHDRQTGVKAMLKFNRARDTVHQR